MKPAESNEWKAPVFILADDDRGALDRISEHLHPEWYYIAVTKPRQVVDYAKRLPATAIFLSDPLDYHHGGSEALLRKLIQTVRVPVVILSERWTAEVAADWKSKGAADCLPHPTRFDQRLELLRSKMQDLALGGGPCRRAEAERPEVEQ